MAALLKAVHEFAESNAQEPAGAGTAEALAQLAEGPTRWRSGLLISPSIPLRCPPDGGYRNAVTRMHIATIEKRSSACWKAGEIERRNRRHHSWSASSEYPQLWPD
jgi:hypothetical protein